MHMLIVVHECDVENLVTLDPKRAIKYCNTLSFCLQNDIFRRFVNHFTRLPCFCLKDFKLSSRFIVDVDMVLVMVCL